MVVLGNALGREDVVVPVPPGFPERVLQGALSKGLEHVEFIFSQDELSLVVASHVPSWLFRPLEVLQGLSGLITRELASGWELLNVSLESSGLVGVSTVGDVLLNLVSEVIPKLWNSLFARVFQAKDLSL